MTPEQANKAVKITISDIVNGHTTNGDSLTSTDMINRMITLEGARSNSGNGALRQAGYNAQNNFDEAYADHNISRNTLLCIIAFTGIGEYEQHGSRVGLENAAIAIEEATGEKLPTSISKTADHELSSIAAHLNQKIRDIMPREDAEQLLELTQ